ncbi:MAG: hypothetical protein HRT44_07300, partial [Bdellovibrionales bacterium]|nr:hypothetical protein [Bdellovibrionales bacterium]NQZ19043.1 hypothetical protein [Bdellovibrionales bacterium]
MVKHYLTESMEGFENKELLDPVIVLALQGFDMALNGAIGYGLQYYAYRFAPAGRMGRLSRQAARGAGWFLIISVLFGGALDISRQLESETIYHQKVNSLSKIINDIDQGRYFSEDSQSQQVINIIEIIEESMKKASQTLYYSYCIDGDLA